MRGAGDLAQLVECLPSMHDSLGLIPSTTKTRHGGVNISTWELEAGGSGVQGGFQPHSEFKAA